MTGDMKYDACPDNQTTTAIMISPILQGRKWFLTSIHMNFSPQGKAQVVPRLNSEENGNALILVPNFMIHTQC